MINWITIILVAACAVAGAEIGRRRAEKKGTFVSRLSYMEQRIYGVIGAVGAALFIETSRLALSEPTEPHVWWLIGASVLVFATIVTQISRELSVTRRELTSLQKQA